MACSDGSTLNEIYGMQERLDEYAKMLCAACKKIESYGLEVPENTKDWWEKHKVEDADREKVERRRAHLMNTLSDEDLRVLGVNRY